MSVGRFLGAFLCLLVLTASASAECAWVLWSASATTNAHVPIAQASVNVRPGAWIPMEAYETAKACAAAESESVQYELTMVKERNKDRAVWQMFIFRCLPDTVDPRGPKVK